MRFGKHLWTLALPLALAGGCEGAGTTVDFGNMNDMMTGGGGGETVEVSGEITASTTWTKDKTYVLKSHVFVKDGATLKIEAGTQVLGTLGSSLVITTSGQIDAQGTAQEPIVFTSARPVGMRKSKDWGGVVLLGLAKINAGNGTQPIEGFPANEARVLYGGNDDTHDCGTLKYVRIEFAGFEIAPGKEINSLTVGGCGSGTTLDYVQTHLGADDGVEFFGGTANLKHAVITQANDDGLDWDFGWTGKVQFLIVQQSKANGNAAFEADGNGSAPAAMPYSNPTIYNATLVGSGPGAANDAQFGMVLRRNTRAAMYNFIVMSFLTNVIDIAGPESVEAAHSGALFVKNSLFFGNETQDQMTSCAYLGGAMAPVWGGCDDAPTETSKDKMESRATSAVTNQTPATLVERDFFMQPSMHNRFGVDPMLGAPASLTAPDFKPAPGSPALTDAATPPSDGFFDPDATFVGAIGATDWTAGWTAYPEN